MEDMTMSDETKKCPYCGEIIKAEARKCRFCGEMLTDNLPIAGNCEVTHKNKPSPFLWITLLIAAITVGLFLSIKHGRVSCDGSAGSGEGASVDVPKEREPVNRPTITAESVERMRDKPVTITTVITTKGKGENAKWGLKTSGSFVLTYVIICDASIESKKVTPIGDIEVVEKRTYRKMDQVLQVFDVDVGLTFSSCLPMSLVNATCGLLDSISFGTGAAIRTGIGLLDGKSVRGLLAPFIPNLGEEVEGKINEFVSHTVNQIIKPASLEGKTYIVTYLQDHEDGRPSNMKFAREDGDTKLTEEEYLVLRRANAFMDSQLMPDKSCSPGHEWNVNAADFDCLLDPYIDGSYDGSVTVSRKDNDDEGNWVLGVAPCVVKIKSKNKTTGSIEIQEGRAYLDATTLNAKTVQIRGCGAMQSITRHHLLFTSRLEGKCEFDAKMVTEPQK